MNVSILFAGSNRDLIPLIAAMIAATLPVILRNRQIRRGENWPVTYGRISSANVDENETAAILKAPYSYRVGEESYRGIFKKNFESSEEAETWKRNLVGRQVTIHYDSRKYSRSLLLESELEPVVRSLSPSSTYFSAERLPWWEQILSQFGFVAAMVGFAACVLELISQIFGKQFLSHSEYVFVMVSALPLSLLAMLRAHPTKTRSWRAVPERMKYIGYVVLFYSLFVAFFPFHPGPKDDRSRKIRDIAYQLPIYFSAIELLYARLRTTSETDSSLQQGIDRQMKLS